MISFRLMPLLAGLLLAGLHLATAGRAESWPEALARMPLGSPVRQLNRTNCVDLMLRAFQSNQTVKALIFMPGATDEFYMFRRAQAKVTNNTPTLFDALAALTNQTLIRATFRPPLLLLHTDEDPLEPILSIQHQPTADRLRQAHYVPHACYNDRDWDFVQPILKRTLKVDMRPWRYSYDSWHFYRHSFAAWNLTGWETLEAIALAGKSKATVLRKNVVYVSDTRVRATPKVENLMPARP